MFDTVPSLRQTAQADLVESFLMRCGAKRDASLAMVEELQMAAGLRHGDVAMVQWTWGFVWNCMDNMCVNALWLMCQYLSPQKSIKI
jgi:hypothetical protein